jgi:hypothetical protein
VSILAEMTAVEHGCRIPAPVRVEGGAGAEAGCST